MNRTLRKYNLKYEYLILEEEDVRLELESYVKDFEKRFDKYYKKSKSKKVEEVWVNEETGEVVTEDPTKKRKKHKFKEKRLKSKSKKVDSVKLKKLFKKLAAFMHPDRGGSDADFHDLNDAYDNSDIIKMLKYAAIYNIEYDIDLDDSKLLSNSFKTMESEIARMKNTLAWSWGTSNIEGKRHVISIVESQTGWKISEEDLPDSMRTKSKENKLLN